MCNPQATYTLYCIVVYSMSNYAETMILKARCMLPNDLQTVVLWLVPHFQEKPDTRHKCDLLHLTDAALNPGRCTVAMLCYLTIQVSVLQIRRHAIASSTRHMIKSMKSVYQKRGIPDMLRLSIQTIILKRTCKIIDNDFGNNLEILLPCLQNQANAASVLTAM